MPRSSRAEADAATSGRKPEILQIKIMQQQRELVLRDDANALIDEMCGVVLTHLSGMAARCSRDMVFRRNRPRGVRSAPRVGAGLLKDGGRARRAAA